MKDYENGNYVVEVCVEEQPYYGFVAGQWSDPLHITIHSGSLFDKENETTAEVEAPPEAAEIPEEDRITSITINPAFNMKNKDDNGVGLDLTKIKIKAKEIYDEAGLKRAEEALGEEIVGNKHYNLLDLTLLYNDEDFSNGYEGLVQVIIPIPKGHREKTFYCYRLTEVNGKMTKEVIPGEQTEDSYIIYLEHFSEYALVADGGEDDHTHTFATAWTSDDTNHWHKATCEHTEEVSDKAAHTWNDGVISIFPTETEKGIKLYTCTTCHKTRSEELPTVAPETKPGYFSSEGETSIKNAAPKVIVTEKTALKTADNGEKFYNERIVQKVAAEDVVGKTKATFTLSNGTVIKTVSTTKYNTALTVDGEKVEAGEGYVFLVYTLTDIPENINITVLGVTLE
ncbi:MAG: hypothetical protein NC084_04325 [Bacteroides sp.]|nr:hypothetical protein [Roseburia sp.]MCM1461926.1 hypothetical protein [Bacteroides sp.]